mmetsp:Transcript_15988/g.27236  ORF Transcript_15988/g.27236 Transcript_15988/m.27236 type:complete len:95 (+) Transcript_15988:281-565(+)
MGSRSKTSTTRSSKDSSSPQNSLSGRMHGSRFEEMSMKNGGGVGLLAVKQPKTGGSRFKPTAVAKVPAGSSHVPKGSTTKRGRRHQKGDQVELL